MKRTSPLVWLVMSISVAGVAAVATYVAKNPKAIMPPQTGLQIQATPPNPNTNLERNPESVMVYTGSIGTNGASFTAEKTPLPSGANPMTFALNQYLHGSGVGDPSARILDVTVSGDNAAIATNEAFDKGYGSFEEHLILVGFAKTLSQFDGLTTFTLEANGKPITTLGSADLTSPTNIKKLLDAEASFGDDSKPTSVDESKSVPDPSSTSSNGEN